MYLFTSLASIEGMELVLLFQVSIRLSLGFLLPFLKAVQLYLGLLVM
ncbi:MAG: hypothetical protein AAF466_03985 [Bacteroidota bacterium]